MRDEGFESQIDLGGSIQTGEKIKEVSRFYQKMEPFSSVIEAGWPWTTQWEPLASDFIVLSLN